MSQENWISLFHLRKKIYKTEIFSVSPFFYYFEISNSAYFGISHKIASIFSSNFEHFDKCSLFSSRSLLSSSLPSSSPPEHTQNVFLHRATATKIFFLLKRNICAMRDRQIFRFFASICFFFSEEKLKTAIIIYKVNRTMLENVRFNEMWHD